MTFCRKRKHVSIFAAVAGMFVLGAGLFNRTAIAQEKPSASPWEKSIAAIEQQDKTKPPPKNAVLFVGSSSIRLWNLSKSFPGLDAINHGFGGSQIADSVQFAPRIVNKYEPRLIVFYAGDNDIGFGKKPEQVAADFRAFAAVVHKDLPQTKILFLSIKPSILRWKLWDKAQRANAEIEDFCKRDNRLVYVDIATPMLGEDGKPRSELFAPDGLHLNAKGYELWASILWPMLR